MKIILSRKGVDSSAGGFASPIFPDGSMLSIAIPDKRSPVCYRDLNGPVKMGLLVKQLSNGRVSGRHAVHLDPDLIAGSIDREHEFLPLFGQCGAAQSHLASFNVGPGDLFLFFGWFREIEYVKRRWRYVSGAADKHVIYGWMQIDKTLPVEQILASPVHQKLACHPHCHGEFSGANTIYSGRKNLSLKRSCRGAGVFRRYDEALCLTAENHSRSIWELPGFMHPVGRDSALSYHTDLGRWSQLNDKVQLKSAARGQEFVLDLDHYPEGRAWVKNLFEKRSGNIV